MFATRVLAALAVFSATAAAAQQSTYITASATQTTVDYGIPVTLSGVVNGGSSPTGSMRFTDAGGGAPVTVALTNRSASYTASNLATGVHQFTLDYLGDASNAPSSAPISIFVRPFPPGVTSVVPSHLPAGSLDTLIFLHGTDFAPASTVTVNGTQVPAMFDTTTQMRAFLPPALLANPGSLSIAVTNADASTTVPAPAPHSFTIDPPGPAPLALAFNGPLATATGLTPGGGSVWLFSIGIPDPYTTYYSVWSRTATDTDSDGQVSMDSRLQSPAYPEFPPRTIAAVVDVPTGNVRIDVSPDRVRSETFFPAGGVTGVRNGEITSLSLAPYTTAYWIVIVVRPGVGAWQSYANQSIRPKDFVPLAGSPPAPATFLPDDVLVALGGNAVTRARLGDYMPQADPAHPGLIVDDAEVLEGNSGFSQLQFGVHLTSAASAPVTVSYATSAISAQPDDYTPATGTLTFQPGETLKTVSIAVAGDQLYEDDERISFTLSAPSGAAILHPYATGWILNDDPIPTLSVGDAAPVVEGTGGSPHTLVFPITLSAPSGTYVDLTMTVLNDGTASTSDLNYTVQTRVLIPAGTTSASWSVPVQPDPYDEEDEVLSVGIYGIYGAARGRDRATGVILDDDAPPVLTPRSVSVREGTGGDTTVDIPVTLSVASGKPVSVDYQLVANGTASPADFVAASGTLNLTSAFSTPYVAPNVVTVTIKGDALREGPETFSLVLSHPTNATLGSPSATITIADDDSGNGVYAAAVLRDQPYLYYRLNEPSGTAVVDASPNGNNAAAGTNVIHNAPGALGSGDPALQFSDLSYGDARVLLPPLGGAGWSEATVEEWVKVAAVPAGSYSSIYAGGQDGTFFSLSTSTTSFGGSIRGDGVPISLSGAPLSPGWHHIVLVARSNASRLYVDGVVAATSSTSFVSLGAATTPAIDGIGAVVDEFAIYRRAFTAADVARHYALRGDGRATADFDGNASNDIVLRNASSGANALWLMNGTAYASTANLPYLPSDFRIEGSADFDGDGQYDLLLRNYTNGNNALWLMNGTSLKSIVNLPWLPTASDFRFEGTGDLNGDGWPDILIRNYTNGNDAVWLMNGTSFTGVANLPALPDANYRMVGSGDFDGDGKADIVWRNRVTGNDAVWLMDGLALKAIANLPALPNTDYRFNGIADYDGDGKPDLVLRNYSNGANALWLLDGVALKSVVNLPMLPNTAYEIVGPR